MHLRWKPRWSSAFARLLGPLALLLLGLVPDARAVITPPAGLNPGAQFRLVFVSSDVRDATSSVIADYDLFIAGLATPAGRGSYFSNPVSWLALASAG